MKQESRVKSNVVNFTFLRIFLILSIVIISTSCGNTIPTEKEVNAENIPSDKIPLLMSDEYSKMKGGDKIYQIKKEDSLIINIGSYEFILPDPAFEYIRDNINYKQMLGGSWAFVEIDYNDSLSLYGYLIEIEKDSILHIDKVMDKINEMNIKDFTIGFRFNIDNGRGKQKIDDFPVHIVN